MLSANTPAPPVSHTQTPSFAYDLVDKPSPTNTAFGPAAYFDLRRPQRPPSRRRSSLRLAKRQDHASLTGDSPSPLNTEPRQSPFNVMKLRHASDPQLSTRFRQDAPATVSPGYEAAPAPTIGYTSPLGKEATREKKPKRSFFQQFSLRSRTGNNPAQPVQTDDKRASAASSTDLRASVTSTPKLSEDAALAKPDAQSRPPSTLLRSSESSANLARESFEAQNKRPSLSTRQESSRSRFFRKPLRKDRSESLFGLPPSLQPNQSSLLNPSSQARGSAASSPTKSPSRSPFGIDPTSNTRQGESPQRNSGGGHPGTLSRLGSQPPPFNAPFLGSTVMRQESFMSASSESSAPGVPPSNSLGFRGRSSTLNSVSGRADDEWSSIPGYQASGRNSEASTTLGRNSIAGLRSFTSRLRHSSEPQSPQRPSASGIGSSAVTSHNNSFALSRETLAVPEREEGETAGKYYARLESGISKRSIAMLMSKSSDPFSGDVLRSLMRTFKFYEEPMDVSLRRFLWEIDLPGEAQQIDRVMSAFSERYHECNPHIFENPDQAYLAAYSLIILHSDLFNKNNKRKMQKVEYQKNTGGHGISDEILGYFYDNIQYTEFIAQSHDDDVVNGYVKGGVTRSKKPRLKEGSETSKGGKLDPYDFIVDNKPKLETLRPPLKEILSLEDSFHYVGSQDALDVQKLHAAFNRCGLLQLVSARSRPEAFTSPNTITNPHEANPGLVNIQVVKTGLLWRKDTKKKKTRSPWQEWGAILTPSQLYFFKNAGWVKTLMSQFETHNRQQGHRGSYLFKPPLSEFKPDLCVSANNAVALLDSTYKKHKNAFVYYQSSGGDYFEEVLLADNEHELVDWLAKLNYAATLTTTRLGLRQMSFPDKIESRGLLEGASASTLKLDVVSGSPPSSAGQDEDPRRSSLKDNKVLRRNVISAKISHVEDNIPKAVAEVEDQLKIARHMQILTPFPEKTRRDLLVSGARVAHRLRTARYTVWRWRCQKDILCKELDAEAQGRDDHLAVTSIASSRPSTPMSIALSRLNSKASVLTGGHKTVKPPNHVSRLSTQSIAMSYIGTETGVSPPEMHLSPPEPPRRHDSSSFRVPTISTGQGLQDTGPDNKMESDATEDRSLRHHSSVASRASAVDAVTLTDLAVPLSPLTLTTSAFETPREPFRHSGTNVESENEHVIPLISPLGSPDTRMKIRRSLHRTLRDSRDLSSLQANRAKRVKDPGGAKDVVNDSAGGGGLPRGTGSFTVHGKKASVITLGSEWQSMSAEELLRSRKQALSDEARPVPMSSPGLERNGEAIFLNVDNQADAKTVSQRTSEDYVTGDEHPQVAFKSGRLSDAPGTPSSMEFDSDAFFDVEESHEHITSRD